MEAVHYTQIKIREGSLAAKEHQIYAQAGVLEGNSI